MLGQEEREANRREIVAALRFGSEKRRIGGSIREDDKVCAVGLAYEALSLKFSSGIPLISRDLQDAVGYLPAWLWLLNDLPFPGFPDRTFLLSWAELADLLEQFWKELDTGNMTPACLDGAYKQQASRDIAARIPLASREPLTIEEAREILSAAR